MSAIELMYISTLDFVLLDYYYSFFVFVFAIYIEIHVGLLTWSWCSVAQTTQARCAALLPQVPFVYMLFIIFIMTG